MARAVVVDDSAFMRSILKNILSQNGAEIVGEAADGVEAVAMINELKPDIVFMDIIMPNKNGIEALKEIRQTNTTTKIIMCTSVGQDKIMTEAIESGASEFIIKPFKPENVKELLLKHTQ